MARAARALLLALLGRSLLSAFVAPEGPESRCPERGRRELLGLGTVAATGLEPARAVGGDTVVLNNGLSFPKA